MTKNIRFSEAGRGFFKKSRKKTRAMGGAFR
jgi:hypothetical protein